MSREQTAEGRFILLISDIILGAIILTGMLVDVPAVSMLQHTVLLFMQISK